jgi:murein DD-endopeptidase MepM/ murein hydrolase activator NlpD
MLILLTSACAPAFELGEATSSSRAREEYVRERARRGDPAIAAWNAAADAALRAPSDVALPYVAYLEVSAGAIAVTSHAFVLRPGGRMRARLSAAGRKHDGVFVELFHQAPSGELRVVDAGLDRAQTLSRDGGRYILRVQPRLGSAGTFRLVIEGDGVWREPAIAALDARPGVPADSRYVFPVDGRDAHAIGSGWGDPRGGGRRHEGVDIFAPRGTPVLAADDGVVLAVRRTSIGGNVIWLRPDGADVELYYAHLDRQDVRPGERVRAGQPIGLVGNTGNARTTPPHLHFGVYRNGGRDAIDPAEWIARSGVVVTVE